MTGRTQILFLSDVIVVVASLDLKVPILFDSGVPVVLWHLKGWSAGCPFVNLLLPSAFYVHWCSLVLLNCFLFYPRHPLQKCMTGQTTTKRKTPQSE